MKNNIGNEGNNESEKQDLQKLVMDMLDLLVDSVVMGGIKIEDVINSCNNSLEKMSGRFKNENEFLEFKVMYRALLIERFAMRDIDASGILNDYSRSEL